MIVIPGKIPIAIHPFFWVTAALIGWLNSPSLFGALIWVGIIFISVLFHEFGHALTAVAMRQKATIQLIALGGVTSYDGSKLKFWQQFLIVFNGPLFGLILCGIATLLLRFDWSNLPLFASVLRATQIANLFWSIVNLLPVLPLDGGQLLRILLEAAFGIRGYKASMLVGATLALILGLGFFLLQQLLAGALFFLFAYQSYDLWRKSKRVTNEDREPKVKQKLLEAEIALQEGRRSEAERLLAEVIEKTKEGMMHRTAMQYLAFLYVQEGKKEEAYQLLLPLEEDLADESKCLLHELAAEHRNWQLVVKLSDCYQISQSPAAALNNARAYAYLHQAKPAGGWLQTALLEGELDLNHILQEEGFKEIQHDPEFQQFLR